ncbi:hypothetical protein J1N10_15250 [Carboxylicivirga sp. A043]|uniref:hypothetical protein n=1 Tax=Carboxylicivirga litoralis TaxID=2816963 RepID=UPI0021CAE424|nr:hypothetical protein [Carboxylicivirga sp. A043]MCU4157332.1 hypothetical protein [Carboxylicivirga sp. A043]
MSENIDYNSKKQNIVIKVISVGILIAYFAYISFDWDYVFLMFADFKNWDFSVIEFLLPIILVPIGVIGLWKIKKIGWLVITIVLTYLLWTIILTTFTEQLGILILIGGLLAYINSPSVIKTFKISRVARILGIGVPTIILFAIWFAIFV